MYTQPETRHIDNQVLFPVVAQLLREHREAELTPQGNSMQPFIRGGVDVVLLRETHTFAPGDILLFVLEGVKGPTYVLHRLVEVEGDNLTFMGDGNLRGYEHCTKADVLGRVVEIRSPRGWHKPLRFGWRLWRWLLPLRWLLLKVDRHVFRHEKFRFYKKWLS